MLNRIRVSFGAGILLVVGACETVSAPEYTPQPRVSASVIAPVGDLGLQMRESHRSRSDAELAAEIVRGSNIVVVGFKPAEARRGVAGDGRPLVTKELIAMYAEQVASVARTVLYRFEQVPAMIVELRSPEDALPLRRLPWIDYVTPNTFLMSPDQIPNDPDASTSCTGPLDHQVVPWNISQVRAPQVWGSLIGRGYPGYLMILDDGYDISASSVEFTIEWSMTFPAIPPDGNEGSHGNRVISAASARDNAFGYVGVANEARIVIADIHNQSGQTLGWESAAAGAIDAALAGTRVISMSFSTKQTSPSAPSSFIPLYDAIVNAYYQRGILITASTGNQENANFYAFPAQWPEVVGVGGSGYSDEYQLNNYAPGNVELAAPALGVGVICKGGASKAQSSGTSLSGGH